MPIELTERQRRLIDAALILAVIALGFVVVTDLAGVFYAFGDVLLLFFLAWLLSFALLPLIRGVASVIPRMPQAGAVIIVYLAIVALLLAVVVQASASLATSIGQFIQDAPRFEEQLQNLLTQVEAQLSALGFQVDLASQAPIIVENLQTWALQLVGPLQSLAFASIGVFGNVLLLVILSIYIAIDRAAIVAFLYRLVPPGFVTEARLLQTSVSKSFGGFLRGQLVMGVVFGVFTAIVNIVFGLEYAALTTVAAGLLHAIPFFGPFVSWLPPVAVALLFDPSAVLPVLIVMGIAWFVTMNVISPRMMSGAVGIHPIVVLASVVIGGKIAGIAGAIFGIPIAAVLSVFFFHWFGRSRENGTVTDRATKRLAQREGRDVRRPREPVPGVDADVDDVGGSPVPASAASATVVVRARARARARARRRAVSPERDDAEGQQPEMTRERARTERRDLDKERGEPVAGPRGVRRSLKRTGRPLGDWTSRPRILVTNDDGIESRGILALKRALDPIGDVTVVAPDTNQSAVGHQKTLMRPLRVRERTLADGSSGYSVDGSPTDCVSLAFLGFFEERFDLVASGINYGANLGDDITYSGTVSAAMEAVINSCPAFAVSQEYVEDVDFELAAVASAIVARNILEHGLKRGELVSVNVPAVSVEDCEGIEVTRVGRRVYQDELTERLDPRGIPYYWIGGPPPSGISVPGTDFNAVVNRRVSVTPIHLDLTGRRLLRQLQTWNWALDQEGHEAGHGADPGGGRGETTPSPVEQARIAEETTIERR